MNLATLKPAKGATKSQKRIARGQGSGKGGTSTRGHIGAQSRSGYSKKSGFEGGQMPLQRRVPKFGFTSPNRVESKPVNLDVLQSLIDSKGLTELTSNTFIEAGLASKNDIVKILGRGVLTSKVDITANHFSKSAILAIEKLGGKVTIS
jgi:large subunit ribosomal protein L15